MTTHDPLAGITDDWLRGVVAAGFVPGVRSRARAALRDLLEEFVAAVRAEPFDPAPGARIGAELVDLRMSAPPVLGTTVNLLAGRLPSAIAGPEGEETRARILSLLESLTTGFVAAQRDAALRAAEEMNRAEKIHWRGVQVDLQQRLQRALLHRPDTGLPNEQHLRKQLAETIAARGGERLGLCLVSLDRYDEVADTLGHENGVRLLTEVARRLRPLGFLAHLADDQFAILLTGTTGVDDVIKVADRASRLLAQHVAVTTGVVERPAAGTDPDGWLHDGRLALRWAVQDEQHADPAGRTLSEGVAGPGSGPIEVGVGGRAPGVFEAGRAESDRRRQRLAAGIPAALAAGEFTLHYQPLVRLADGAVIGVEALARWHRLEPRQFIAMAERTGVIHELGRNLLEQACRAGAARPDLRMSVNMSPVQLAAPGLVAGVADILHRTGMPAERLQLEITETAAVIEHRAVLDRLAALGLRLALDDFGTGYSSLAELMTLPFAEVKLAAEFLTAQGGTIAEKASARAKAAEIVALHAEHGDAAYTRADDGGAAPTRAEDGRAAPARAEVGAAAASRGAALDVVGQAPATRGTGGGDLGAGVGRVKGVERMDVVRHVVGLCHALGVTVTAEGIEGGGQARALREAGCDHGQGYLFGRPVAGLP
ncbi:EAL domain-containing protein [Actinoplanes sp. CA-054009]